MYALSNEQHQAVARRRRRAYTGSAALLVTGFTDDHLERVVADELAAREAAWLHYNVEEVQRAAQLELDWRDEQGLRFGWSSRR